MPTIEQNVAVWGGHYDWEKQGDEWSEDWGGAEMQWHGSIMPRIHHLLPTTSILELAPGFGRWTQFLKNHCERLVVVDLNERCIEKCKERFRNVSNIAYNTNDGKSLHMVDKASIDLIFSFDSLVHAEFDVMEAYLSQFAGLLKDHGRAVIHHSNFGACNMGPMLKALLKIPKLRGWLRKSASVRDYENVHWRASTVSAANIRNVSNKYGLQCLSQELINWRGSILNDCISVFTKALPHSSGDCHAPAVYSNYGFMDEARMLKRLSRNYSS